MGVREIIERIRLAKIHKDSPCYAHPSRGICKVVDVYDGDTVTVAYYPRKLTALPTIAKARLYGIDTPELRPSRHIPDRAEVIQRARDARDALRELVHGAIVRYEYVDHDKYGRLLLKLFVDGHDVTDILIENGFGKSYFGGTKT